VAAGQVLIAPDKFKGSLSARAVADHVAAGMRSVRPELEIVTAPIADGGDGTVDVVVAAGFHLVTAQVSGPTGAALQSGFAVRDGCAVVELAAASGLALLPAGFDPLHATSRGTGELIAAALDHGCTEIVLGVGGSACTDGGAGLLQALGARLLDASGEQLPPGGAALASLDRVELTALDRRLASVRVTLASDVDNPLHGPAGAAQVYGPQKGASPADVALLEAALIRWADALDPAAAALAGAGAAGGVGFAALSVLHARRRPGIDVVLDLIGFDDLLDGAALVITGEGSLDEQTLHGKAPAGVAALAGRAGVPVLAVCGRLGLDRRRLAEAGILAAYALSDVEADPERCMLEAGALLERLGAIIAGAHLAQLPEA